jgi:hypothetical protein
VNEGVNVPFSEGTATVSHENEEEGTGGLYDDMKRKMSVGTAGEGGEGGVKREGKRTVRGKLSLFLGSLGAGWPSTGGSAT